MAGEAFWEELERQVRHDLFYGSGQPLEGVGKEAFEKMVEKKLRLYGRTLGRIIIAVERLRKAI